MCEYNKNTTSCQLNVLHKITEHSKIQNWNLIKSN